MYSKKKSSGELVAEIDALERYEDLVGVWITYTGAAYYSYYYNRLKEIDLKPVQVTALAFIEKEDGITQSQLGRKLKINRASAMSLSNDLTEAGLISKEQMARLNQVALHLTEAGQKKLEAGCEVEAKITSSIFNNIEDADKDQFLKTLKNLFNNINNL